MHNVIITYDRPTIRRSVRRFWLRFTWKGLSAIAILLPILLFFILSGDRSWFVGFIAAVFLIGVASAAALYLALMSRAMQKLAGNPTKEVRMTFTEDRMSIDAPDSNAGMPWKAVKRIWRFPGFWLIFLGGGAGYFTLPLKSVDATAQAFILQQVKAHGGKIK